MNELAYACFNWKDVSKSDACIKVILNGCKDGIKDILVVM
jgi:hypothetical protein